MSINKRVFGTPITGLVRDKLEARQGETANLEPGHSLEGRKVAVSNYDYASRLPFVRMWTSVKLISQADVQEIASFTPAELNTNIDNFDNLAIENKFKEIKQKAINKYKSVNVSFQSGVDNSKVSEIKDDDGKVIKYVVKAYTRDQQDFNRKIYEIGNHNYLKNYGESQPNESVFEGQTYVDTDFPNESQKNPYMKPQSGITSISSETEGSLGLIKKTTVNFVVHNFYDFDNIFSKYFLKPAAQIFVDFGFADIPNLYRPQDLIDFAEHENNDGVQGYLYGEPSDDETNSVGFVTKNQGDVEVLQGIVTDYSATVQKDGSVNCSVTLTSKNDALLSFSTDTDIVMRIRSILTSGVLYLGLRAVVSSGDPDDVDNDLQELMSTPNISPGGDGSDTVDTYDQNLRILARQKLSNTGGSPTGDSIRTGVFLENLNADDSYIAWGLFEDLIINSQFGFGKDFNDINEGKNFQVKMNSSNSFTKWSEQYTRKQKVLLSIPDEPPAFIFPKKWGAMDDPTIYGSYSNQNNKLPVFTERDKDGNIISTKSYKNEEFNYEDDIKQKRIPIREVFINTDVIIKAFESNSDVRKVILEILDKLNKESDGLFDWKMKEGETDAEIEIIDANYTIATENQKLEIKEDPFFIFRSQSPNSMITDYNLDFKLPSGDIGNMYAIQGMGTGDTLFTTNPKVQTLIAAGSLDKDLLKIIYEPDMGNYRAKEMLDEPKVDGEMYDAFRDIDNLFDNNVYQITTTEQPALIRKTVDDDGKADGLTNEKAVTKDKDDTPKFDPAAIINQNIKAIEGAGFKVAKSFREYYSFKLNAESQDEVPNLLPYTLTLTIAGIASLQVGDTFKVDYLPKDYQDSTYLQIIKITHAIAPNGWYTTLDTQFRLTPDRTNIVNNQNLKDKVRLSPNVLTNLAFENKIEADDGLFSWGNDVSMKTLAPYMTDIKVSTDVNAKYDFEIDFRVAVNLQGEIKDEGGLIKNSRGNFRVEVTGTSAKKKLNSMLEAQGKDFYDSYGTNIDNFFNLFQLAIGKGDSEGDAYHYGYDDTEVSTITREFAWPPDVRLRPKDRYTILVKGNTLAILDQKNTYFKRTKQFFKDNVGITKLEPIIQKNNEGKYQATGEYKWTYVG